ncbi:LysR family transcriptional regulator [Pelagibacterium limicola]|uniref:LysR family transcriptional regulator n=1 Tax=Pelagibacterium limicola TaxID=2791022 RepID=UPI0018AFDE93|nr:LysR family transcriptional regulator [Pelagibacterium limicola]
MDILGRLTFKQLRAFVLVYQHRKLAAAAEDLGVTQSAVSVLIRQIESALNIRLFDRTTRSLEPTLAATEIFGMAERILQDVGSLVDSAGDLTAGIRGRVTLTATPATASGLLTTTVRRFAREYSSIRLVLDDCAPNQFLPNIQGERVEFGVGTPPPEGGDFISVPLIEDTLHLVCSETHALADREAVSWADLTGHPIIAFRPGYGVRRLVDSVAARNGVTLDIAHEAGFLDTAIWMAAVELGACILPSTLARNHAHNTVRLIPMINPEVKRTVALVTKRGRSLSPACQIFVNMLRADLGVSG